MKILHIITNLSRAGAEMMLYKLLSQMNREEFAHVVISLTGYGYLAERIAALGVPVFAVGMRPSTAFYPSLWRLMRLARQAAPDLVQGWQYHGNLAAQLVRGCLQSKVPVIWNIRHSIYNLADERRGTALVIKLGARFSRKAERVIYVARTSALQHEALGYDASKGIVIPNGFDTEQFAPSEEARYQLRTELGLPSSALVIGSIARYHPVKDHHTFLAAAAALFQSHPGVHFVLVGEHLDRTNVPLMRVIESLGLGANIHLLGERADIPRITAALDIAVSSSYGEGFSNVIGEAMACGIPCVVTDVGDSAFLVGEAGRVIPPRNPQALAAAWAELIEMGRDARMMLGLRARQRIQENFSLPTIAARYAQLYRDIGVKSLGLSGRLA